MYKKYFIVNSLSDAVELKKRYSDSSKIIAGGTDLMLEFEKGQHAETNEIIDISRIKDLDQILLDGQKMIHIGPMVTHSGCLKSELIRRYARCLYQACENVGSPQIRNRGTIAGNLITASPANDTISALMALNASIELISINGKRTIEIKDFFTGVRKTKMMAGEIVSDITFAVSEENFKSAFIKNALRNVQAISILNVSVVCSIANSKFSQVRIALGSVAPTVIRAMEAERLLVGKEPTEGNFEKAGMLAAEAASPISDIRASDYYRRKMIAVHVKRAFLDAMKESSVQKGNAVLLWGKEKFANQPLYENTLEIDQETTLQINVNGKELMIKNAFHKNLLDLLRENALLTGTKEGCGEGECGACTIYMDGIAVMACLIPAPRAHLCKITTIEAISTEGKLHKVQQAFMEEGAVQCGYCTPGFIMSAVKLLEEITIPSEEEIKTGISGNLCRCTGYYKILTAIEKAAER